MSDSNDGADPLGIARGAEALSKPVTKLIEACRDGAGVLYEPRRIRKKAEADADALVIATEAEIQQNDLLRRAAHRMAAQEARRQENIETIMGGAIEQLPDEVSEEDVDPDWTANFFDHCKDVSDEDLQELWSRILSNEVAQPGTCHPSTLAVIRNLTREDAENFELICSVVVESPGYPRLDRMVPYSQVGRDKKVNFGHLVAAQGLGLMRSGSVMALEFSQGALINYQNTWYGVQGQWTLRHYPLTRAGSDLYSILDPEYDDEIVSWLESVDALQPLRSADDPDDSPQESSEVEGDG